jgi:lipopolysaccharide export system protein LptC
MAIQTHIRQAPARFAGLPSGGDRTKAFRAAKRHSARVRMLRLLFPVGAVCAMGMYFLPSRISVAIKDGEASVESLEVSSGGLKMVNPRIKGVHEKYGVYDIKADHATQQAKNPELMNLTSISAEITSKTGEITVLTAPSGLYHSKQEELTFDNGVVIGGEAGISGTLKTATAFMQAHKLISHDPVDLAFHGTTIKAQSMTLYSGEGRAIFEGNVKVHLERKPKEAGNEGQ